MHEGRSLRMLGITGPLFGVLVVGIVWALMALVIVAAVVVGGRAERRFREAESDPKCMSQIPWRYQVHRTNLSSVQARSLEVAARQLARDWYCNREMKVVVNDR